MSEAPTRQRRLPLLGIATTAASLGWAALAYYGLGADLAGTEPEWWQPRGSLHGFVAGLPLPDGGAANAAVGALPALVLAVAVFLTTRSALARTLATAGVVASGCFAFYGLGFSPPWRIFGASWSATMVVFALVVGAALCAVFLARSWRRLPAWAQLAAYLPVFAAVVLLERNITGTDPSLPFALSPWPAVQVFGLELIATPVAFVLLGVGIGLLVAAGLREQAGRAGAPLLGVAAGAVLPGLVLGAGAGLNLLAFRVGPVLLGAAAFAAAVVATAAGAPLAGLPQRLRERGRLFAGAGLLLALPLVAGQALTRWDYVVTRDQRAQAIIGALETHYAETDAYPDELSELVEAQRLRDVPSPRVGFSAFPTQDGFVYQNFGMSYLLEFSAPRWIQCAYNPPYVLEEDEEPLEDDEDLGGSWSCPSTPPELW